MKIMSPAQARAFKGVLDYLGTIDSPAFSINLGKLGAPVLVSFEDGKITVGSLTDYERFKSIVDFAKFYEV